MSTHRFRFRYEQEVVLHPDLQRAGYGPGFMPRETVLEIDGGTPEEAAKTLQRALQRLVRQEQEVVAFENRHWTVLQVVETFRGAVILVDREVMKSPRSLVHQYLVFENGTVWYIDDVESTIGLRTPMGLQIRRIIGTSVLEPEQGFYVRETYPKELG